LLVYSRIATNKRQKYHPTTRGISIITPLLTGEGLGVRLCSFEEAARRELFCIDYNPSSNIIQIHSKNREKTTKLDYIAPYRAIYIILNLF
jgi:hypothetical protein